MKEVIKKRSKEWAHEIELPKPWTKVTLNGERTVSEEEVRRKNQIGAVTEMFRAGRTVVAKCDGGYWYERRND